MRAISILSGGQTGADRAALDFALAHGIPHSGWCPRGRLAEDGSILATYQLSETPSRKYAQRTEWNVRDSDATVVFTLGEEVKGGSALTIELAQRLGKPWLHLSRDSLTSGGGGELAVLQAAEQLNAFLVEHPVERLNVAGPRASQEPEIAAFVVSVLEAAIGV